MQQKKNTVLNPSSIQIDFEKATINAINNVFLQTLVRACQFRFAQNAWKKVLKNMV